MLLEVVSVTSICLCTVLVDLISLVLAKIYAVVDQFNNRQLSTINFIPVCSVVQKVRRLIQTGIINFSDIVSLVSTISHYNIALLITEL